MSDHREGKPTRRPVWVRRVRGWWHDLSTPATSARGVEGLLAVAVVLIRVGIVVEMSPSLPEGLASSPRPGLYGLMWTLAAGVSFVVAIAAAQGRGNKWRPHWMLGDVTATVLFLALGSLVVSSDFRVNSWVGWQPGYALTVLLTIGGLRSRRLWIGSLAAVGMGYLVYALPGLTEPGITGSILGTLLTYAVMGSIPRFAVSFLRRTAADADAARHQAGVSAAAAEAARARLVMHNATTVMQLLADPHLPPVLRHELQRQAVDEVRRMRDYLRNDPSFLHDSTPSPSGQVPLSTAVTHALDGFGDLGLEPSLWLADRVVLPPHAAAAVTSALVALLHNIRVHADSTSVIIHAEGRRDGAWRVTVRDDGRGYDPGSVSYGVGIREQVIDQLRQYEIQVAITSSVGAGTRTVLTGDHPPPPPARSGRR